MYSLRIQQMNALLNTATATEEYDCIDQYGEVNKGRLVKDKIIGCGMSGFVRREFLITNNKAEKVAVKYQHKSCNECDLQKEITALKSCKHENIVRFIGWVLSDDGKGIVMEFMEGKDLHKYLINPDRAVMVSQIFSYITQIVDAFVYLQHMHILHRNLAARNCLLNADYTVVKICDFGIARKMDQDYQYCTDSNRPLPFKWYPLEVMEAGDRIKFTSKVDIWSFGVLIWEMFERGAMPYYGVDFVGYIRFLKKGERLRRPQHCPDALYALMQRCWHVNPTERPAFDIIKERIKSIINDIEINEPTRMNTMIEFTADDFSDSDFSRADISQKTEHSATEIKTSDNIHPYEIQKNSAARKDEHLYANVTQISSDR